MRLHQGDFVVRDTDDEEPLRMDDSDDGLLGCFYSDPDMRHAYLTVDA